MHACLHECRCFLWGFIRGRIFSARVFDKVDEAALAVMLFTNHPQSSQMHTRIAL